MSFSLKSSPSITMLIPYFGKWPEWIDLYFETVRRNRTIDFVIYTDCPIEDFDIPNVTFKPTSFDEYVENARSKTGAEFDPADPYKLCDLRPLYPILHFDDIKDSDFYGWTDLDILYGDIRSFYTDEVLSRYDVFSTHFIRISGHFALFRNTKKNRNKYRKIYDWKAKLKHPYFVGIDEHGITNAFRMTIFDKLNEKFNTNISNAFTRFIKRLKTKRLYLKEQYTTPFFSQEWLDGSKSADHPDTWFYADGKISNNRDDRDFMYFHFMNFQKSKWRHDGKKAPWEEKEKVCYATAADMKAGVIINKDGIFPRSDFNGRK